MSIEEFHTELSRRVAGDKPNIGLALLRALLLFAVAFTFLSGVVFTVGPMVLMAADHVVRHIIIPVQRWLSYDPVTGFWMAVLFNACVAISVAYLCRHYILLAGTFLASRVTKLMKLARRRPASTVPQRSNHENR